MDDPKDLSFSQRFGLEDLPSQLQPGSISQEFRARVWAIIHFGMEKAKHVSSGLYSGHTVLTAPWVNILHRYWLNKLHRAVDEFDERYARCTTFVKSIILEQPWNKTLDFIEFVLRDKDLPRNEKAALIDSFRHCRLAYDVADGDTIIEVSGPEHADAVADAIEMSKGARLAGVELHLKKAGALLTAGDWHGSIRESVHSIEALVRQVAGGKSTFNDAMKKIEKHRSLHPQLKQAFQNLYNYSSDEGGVRHPFVDEENGRVDENLALFYHHACAAFIGFVLRMQIDDAGQFEE